MAEERYAKYSAAQAEQCFCPKPPKSPSGKDLKVSRDIAAKEIAEDRAKL